MFSSLRDINSNFYNNYNNILSRQMFIKIHFSLYPLLANICFHNDCLSDMLEVEYQCFSIFISLMASDVIFFFKNDKIQRSSKQAVKWCLNNVNTNRFANVAGENISQRHHPWGKKNKIKQTNNKNTGNSRTLLELEECSQG